MAALVSNNYGPIVMFGRTVCDTMDKFPGEDDTCSSVSQEYIIAKLKEEPGYKDLSPSARNLLAELVRSFSAQLTKEKVKEKVFKEYRTSPYFIQYGFTMNPPPLLAVVSHPSHNFF